MRAKIGFSFLGVWAKGSGYWGKGGMKGSLVSPLKKGFSCTLFLLVRRAPKGTCSGFPAAVKDLPPPALNENRNQNVAEDCNANVYEEAPGPEEGEQGKRGNGMTEQGGGRRTT